MASFERAQEIVEKLQDSGYTAVFAGGCVRDSLLDAEPHDYDIATNAAPDTIEEMFSKTISIGKSSGVIVVVSEGEEFEVSTFREDGVVLHTSNGYKAMIVDAQRRDLTIDGLFFNPINGEVYDFVSGQQDLRDRCIRFIGNPRKRIEEDKLRMLIAIRFAMKLDFEVELWSSNAIRDNIHKIKDVSTERIKDELCKMFVINPSDALKWLNNFGALEFILPEVCAMIGGKELLALGVEQGRYMGDV